MKSVSTKVTIKDYWQKLRAPKKPEPSYPKLPAVDDKGQTTVPGLYAVGEVAGTPLVKLGMNAGYDLVMSLSTELKSSSVKADYDLIIIGAGASGLSAALTAKKQGLTALTIESNHLAETVYTMTKGKVIYANPVDVETKGELWFEECTKEELLQKWAEQVEAESLQVHLFEKVEDIVHESNAIKVTTNKASYTGKKVILAAGKSGNPRKAGVPGEKEFPEKITHRLTDPDEFSQKNVLVYGGGDVALEAAVSLAESNNVTMVTIDPEFVYPSKRNIDRLKEKVKQGKVDLHFKSSLKAISKDSVTFVDANGSEKSIPNDHVFEMIGAELPLQFFSKIGVRLENTWTVSRYALLFGVFLCVYCLYALKSYGKGITAWPFESLISPNAYDTGLRAMFDFVFIPFKWMFSEEAYKDILGDRGYQQGFLYSGLYTVIMIVFGWEAMLRWRSQALRKKYQTYRYISLISFQVGFFMIVNVLAVQWLSVKYAWRAWGLYQPFPLFFNTFFWWYDGDPVSIFWFFMISGLIGTFIVIPYLARFHGKRFCTWVCGCGGLAETLGDRWRHLSTKGERSRSWEFQSVAVMLAAFMIGVVIVGIYRTDGNNIWWRAYNYIVDFWLVAIIPIALYPFFGGKVWCRYWCPLAAWNQVLAKKFGKLKIVSDDKCISCTQCSKYCQVGVDVMAFAKKQQYFDNTNSSCIHCGICIDVCPMDVLSFATTDKKAS